MYFTVEKLSVDVQFRFIGSEVYFGDEAVEISISDFMDLMKRIKIPEERRHKVDLQSTKEWEA